MFQLGTNRCNLQRLVLTEHELCCALSQEKAPKEQCAPALKPSAQPEPVIGWPRSSVVRKVAGSSFCLLEPSFIPIQHVKGLKVQALDDKHKPPRFLPRPSQKMEPPKNPLVSPM